MKTLNALLLLLAATLYASVAATGVRSPCEHSTPAPTPTTPEPTTPTPTTSTPPSRPPSKCAVPATDTDYASGDVLASYGSSPGPDAYCAQCERTRGCVAYTYQPVDRLGMLRLRRGRAAHADAGHVCHVGPCRVTPAVPSPNYLETVLSSLGGCCLKCALATTSCAAYSYNDATHRCVLKASIESYTLAAGWMSGVNESYYYYRRGETEGEIAFRTSSDPRFVVSLMRSFMFSLPSICFIRSASSTVS